MVKTTLLATDFELGSRILEWLDQSNLAIKVAAWVYLEDYEEWRFALASPRLDAAEGATAYGLVLDALRAAGLPTGKTPTFIIFGMKDPFTRALRALFAKTKSVEEMRIGSQRIGDRYVEDGILYRVR
jgi:pimeloyl-ACP methyl ester carboxylesterase